MEKNYMSALAVEVQEQAAPLKISQKIVGWAVNKTTDEEGNTHEVREAVTLERPRVVEGRTYKISPAVTDSAMYITINDAVMEDGSRRPLEMFINTKHVSHQQWITALTRMVSAIFRKPGPYLFVADELKEIFDPQGGYFDGGKMMPSVVAHVAEVLKEHFIWIGAMEAPALTAAQKEVIAEKVAVAEKSGVKMQLCMKCKEEAMLMLDGCMTCTNCGESKCG
jgi:hypothetical protein